MGCSCCPCCDKVHSFIERRCTDRMMIAMNIIACAMMVVCIVFRFVYFAKGGNTFFFLVLTIYLAIFLTLEILAEFKIQRVRTYFDFLDTKWGRGWFILFIALLVLEKETALEVILCILTIVIALLNMFVGLK